MYVGALDEPEKPAELPPEGIARRRAATLDLVKLHRIAQQIEYLSFGAMEGNVEDPVMVLEIVHGRAMEAAEMLNERLS